MVSTGICLWTSSLTILGKPHNKRMTIFYIEWWVVKRHQGRRQESNPIASVVKNLLDSPKLHCFEFGRSKFEIAEIALPCTDFGCIWHWVTFSLSDSAYTPHTTCHLFIVTTYSTKWHVCFAVYPVQIFAVLKSYSFGLSVGFLSYDRRSTLIRLGRRKKIWTGCTYAHTAPTALPY